MRIVKQMSINVLRSRYADYALTVYLYYVYIYLYFTHINYKYVSCRYVNDYSKPYYINSINWTYGIKID